MNLPHRGSKNVTKRVRFSFSGIVQGVGFRPFIHRVAVKHGLGGFVQNRPNGVIAEVEGEVLAIEHFCKEVLGMLPPNANIAQYQGQDVAPVGESIFQIIPSAVEGARGINIPPDIATCDECLREIFNPANKRFKYPFTNCTNCGPRFTILRDVPYDRRNTSMGCMPLCAECRAEYENVADRRFHAEPNACPVCGPTLWLADAAGKPLPVSDPIDSAVALLKSGHIVAIKGLGGFHLAVDAANEEAVKRLRARKCREEKPLALMVRDIASAKLLAVIDDDAERLLCSPAAPIVLVKKKGSVPSEPRGKTADKLVVFPVTDLGALPIAAAVAPGVPYQGIMLPNTPLHHLLLQGFTGLVMTSGNRVDEPICIANREAVTGLTGIADFFLFHNRDILVRCDDSLLMMAAGKPRVLRRARGFVPETIKLHRNFLPVLALGSQMKTTVCVLKGEKAFLSPHIGDMETPEARDFHRLSLKLALKIAECDPDIIACDLHPGYHTSLLAQRMLGAKRLIRVQHHHAHVVSCMAENGITGEVIGIAMDGSGYGPDGSVWGGEFLVANEASFQRKGCLRTFFLPGSEMAIHEPWRIGASLLAMAYGEAWRDIASRLGLFPDGNNYGWMENIMSNERVSPITSSLGRVFDGVAALLGVNRKVSFEGQAAMGLEALATAACPAAGTLSDAEGASYRFAIQQDGNIWTLDLFPAIRDIVQALEVGEEKAWIALCFHKTLALSLAAMAAKTRQETGLQRVVLSGGCFQNRLLLEGCEKELREQGFIVFTHSRVPANDGGVSLGQALIAAAQCE